MRRNSKGIKREDFNKWEDQPFEEMIGGLAIQQHIQQTIRKDNREITLILTPPATLDNDKAWIYEHMRQICMELNILIVGLQKKCTKESCPFMKGSNQWFYFCAMHSVPKECPAIEYARHTLDGVTAVLNSSVHFPSRVNIDHSAMMKLEAICRRIYRIFLHAYYQHLEVFFVFENDTFLCRRFSVLASKYNLLPLDKIVIPMLKTAPRKLLPTKIPVSTTLPRRNLKSYKASGSIYKTL